MMTLPLPCWYAEYARLWDAVCILSECCSVLQGMLC
jgi:hypothetical protein